MGKFLKTIFSSTLSRVLSTMVVSGLSLLIPGFKEFILENLFKIKVFILWSFGSHLVSGWFLYVSLSCIMVVALRLIYWFFSLFKNQYTEDVISGARWRWSWSGGIVVNPSPFCPVCDLALSYDDNRYEGFTGSNSVPHTKFICDNCNSPKAVISGGYYSYALSYVAREAERRNRDKKSAKK